ncbi:MAG: hypothetical protein N3D11_02190 [Candidatus Sumerlaeia bacterium]|nr:hypothetical protein [Candidatus Sumerlaeia bacterium]
MNLRFPAFILLMTFLALGHLAPHERVTHGHEGNNMTGAWLVANGWHVYRDLFCHHPPFPFWYGGVAARLFGGSAATFHWALLAFYVAALAVLFRANRRSAGPFSFGLLVLFLTLGHPLYWGHLFLADMFSAFALLVVFYHFWRYDAEHDLTLGDWLVIGAAAFVAIGSTLLAAYPLALLAAGLLIKHFRYEEHGQRFVRLAWAAALAALPFAAGAFYIWLTGSVREFWDQVIVGSIHYYRTDTGYSHLAPSLSPLFFLFINLGRKFLYIVSTLLFGYGALEAAWGWVHVFVIATLVRTGRWPTALFYFGYVLTLMLRMYEQYGAPYLVHTFWAAAWLLQPVGEMTAAAWRSVRSRVAPAPVSYSIVLQTAAAVLVVVLLAQPFIAEIKPAPPPEPAERETARLCAELTAPSDRIAVFPVAPDIYREANRQPAVPSFSYYYWQDRVGPLRREMVRAFEEQKAKLVVINWWGPPGGIFAFRNIAEDIRDAIRRNYQPLSVTVPSLYARNASFHELLGRYEQVRRTPVIEVPERNTLPLAVFGPVAAVQFLSVNERVTSARIEVLISALRRADSTVEFEFGYLGSSGEQRIVVRTTFPAAEVRYYPGLTDRTYWRSFSLARAGILKPGRRYFFRLRSPDAATPEALQVWSAPRPNLEAVGDTLCGGAPTSRTLCFRLKGVTHRKGPGVYPVVEQSLGRTVVAAADIRQTLALNEATTLAAAAFLLGTGDGTSTPATQPLRFEILDKNGRVLTSQTITAPAGRREWTDVAFPPVLAGRGDVLTLALRAASPTTGALCRALSAGCDLYSGGSLMADGQPRTDDLAFKLYSTPPHQRGLPDIAVTALKFDPASPLSAAPGAPLRLTLRLENRGTTPTGSFWVEFMAAPKDLSGPSAFLCESLPVPQLKAGEVLEQSFSRPLHPLPDGLYTVTVVADRIRETAESDEENNRLEVEGMELLVVARESRTNLFVDQFKVVGSRVQRGRSIEFQGLVSNNGKVPAGRFVIEFWAAPEPDRAASRMALCDPIVIESLVPDALVDLAAYPRTLRPDVQIGRLYIGCTVDARDDVNEVHEWDNTASAGPVVIEP